MPRARALLAPLLLLALAGPAAAVPLPPDTNADPSGLTPPPGVVIDSGQILFEVPGAGQFPGTATGVIDYAVVREATDRLRFEFVVTNHPGSDFGIDEFATSSHEGYTVDADVDDASPGDVRPVGLGRNHLGGPRVTFRFSGLESPALDPGESSRTLYVRSNAIGYDKDGTIRLRRGPAGVDVPHVGPQPMPAPTGGCAALLGLWILQRIRRGHASPPRGRRSARSSGARGWTPRLLGGALLRLGATFGLAATLVPPPARAQNLLFNGDFPEVLGLAGWEVTNGSASWSPFERGFSAPWLGSARVSGGNNGSIVQCVPAFAGTTYRLSGWAFLDQGPEVVVQIRFLVGTCDAWAPNGSGQVRSEVLDEWVFLDVTYVAPPNTTAARAELHALDSQGGGVVAFFDDIELPEPGSAGAGAALGTLAALRACTPWSRARACRAGSMA